jgi:hypothetical protein
MLTPAAGCNCLGVQKWAVLPEMVTKLRFRRAVRRGVSVTVPTERSGDLPCPLDVIGMQIETSSRPMHAAGGRVRS